MKIGFLKNNWDLVAITGAGITASTAALTGNLDLAANGLGVTSALCVLNLVRNAFTNRQGSLVGAGILAATIAVTGSQVLDFSNFPHPPAREIR